MGKKLGKLGFSITSLKSSKMTLCSLWIWIWGFWWGASRRLGNLNLEISVGASRQLGAYNRRDFAFFNPRLVCFTFTFLFPPLRARFLFTVPTSFYCISSSLGFPFSSISLLVFHLRWEFCLNGVILWRKITDKTLFVNKISLSMNFTDKIFMTNILMDLICH